MSENYLTIREHEPGQDVAKQHTLKLSCTAEEITYAIILKTSWVDAQQTLLIINGDLSDPDCQALLRWYSSSIQ